MSQQPEHPLADDLLTESQRTWQEEDDKYRSVMTEFTAVKKRAEGLLHQLREGQKTGRVTDRKVRLVLCACVRQGLWHLLTDPRSRAAIDFVERFADGQATDEELNAARTAAGAAAADTPGICASVGIGPIRGACSAAWAATWSMAAAPSAVCRYYVDASGASEVFALSSATRKPAGEAAPRHAFDELLARLIAEIVGPERLPTVDPAWLDWQGGAILNRARTLYHEACFTDVPILADALEEAGCADAPLLGHLRGPGLHVRGCWALDLLLGKL